MNCPICSADVDKGYRFCPRCGEHIVGALGLEDASKKLASSGSEAGELSKKAGVRGWLLVFCVLITIVFPISSCSGFSEVMSAPTKYGVDADSQAYKAISLSASVSGLVGFFGFLAGVAMWVGSPGGRLIALVFLVLYPISITVSNLSAIEMMKGTDSGDVGLELLRGIIGAFIFSAIWIPYFIWSKRVKNTYC